jgi:hypothetical protein
MQRLDIAAPFQDGGDLGEPIMRRVENMNFHIRPEGAQQLLGAGDIVEDERELRGAPALGEFSRHGCPTYCK